MDMDRKFSNISDSSLLDHLKNSLSSTRNGSTCQSISLLQPIHNELKKLADDPQIVIERLVKAIVTRRQNLLLLGQLHLKKLQLQQMIPSTPLLHDCNQQGVVSVLQNLGVGKEYLHVESQIADVIRAKNVLDGETDQYITQLARQKRLTSSIQRGNVDDCVSWLLGRSLGMSSFTQGYGSALNKIAASTSSNMKMNIISHFKVLWKSSGHMQFPVYCVCFDQTGRYIITGADDYLLKIWDVERGQLVHTCRGHRAEITIIVVSMDNALIASACVGGYIRIWRLVDGVCVLTMQHRATINWLKFDPDRGGLVSVGDDGQCIVWDLGMMLDVDEAEAPLLTLLTEGKASFWHSRGANQGDHDSPKRERGDEALTSMQGKPFSINKEDMLPTRAIGGSGGFGGIESNGVSRDDDGAGDDGGGGAGGAATVTGVVVDVDRDMGGDLEEGAAKGRGSLYEWPVSEDVWSGPRGRVGQGCRPPRGPIRRGDRIGPATDAAPGHGESTNVSSQQGFDFKLVLPHINDSPHLCQGGEEIKINCVDIFPGGNVLVTGCEDGVARVWRFATERDAGDDASVFASSHSTRRTTAAPANAHNTLQGLASLRGVLSPGEMQRLETVALYLLLRMEGHVNAVTDIHFSNTGDRIMTASLLDGTVRVWAVTKGFTKCDQMVINVNESDGDPSGGGPAPGAFGKRAARKRNKPQVI